MATLVKSPGSPKNEPADGPDSTRTRDGAMNNPSRRVGSGGSSGGGASVAGGGTGTEGASSSSSLVRSMTIAPGGFFILRSWCLHFFYQKSLSPTATTRFFRPNGTRTLNFSKVPQFPQSMPCHESEYGMRSSSATGVIFDFGTQVRSGTVWPLPAPDLTFS